MVLLLLCLCSMQNIVQHSRTFSQHFHLFLTHLSLSLLGFAVVLMMEHLASTMTIMPTITVRAPHLLLVEGVKIEALELILGIVAIQKGRSKSRGRRG